MRGAELHRLLALELDRVDGDDPLGAGELGALDGVGADAADTDDGDRVAGLDLGGVDRRAPAGDDAAAEQAGPLERHVLVDLDAARLVDDGVMGERAEQAHRQPEVLALRAWWRAVPSDICMPMRSDATEVAQVRSGRSSSSGQRPQAGMNPNTTWSPGASQLTPVADLQDDAGALVAADDGGSVTPARSPVTRCSSLWHMPLAAILTSTSPAFGGSSSISSTLHGVLRSHRIAALVFIVDPP